MKIIFLFLSIFTLASFSTACTESDSSLQNTAEDISDSMNDIGNDIEDACEDIKDDLGAKDKDC